MVAAFPLYFGDKVTYEKLKIDKLVICDITEKIQVGLQTDKNSDATPVRSDFYACNVIG